MPLQDKTSLGFQRWFVDYERESFEEAMACIYFPILGFGGNARVSVAEIDYIALDTEVENAETETIPIREGEDAERLRYVCLIVHAPDMRDVIQRCLRRLDELCDGKFEQTTPMDVPLEHRQKLYAMLNTDENHALWVRLCEIQRELQIVDDAVTDLERV